MKNRSIVWMVILPALAAARSPLRLNLTVTALTFVCFGLLPKSQAVLPAPDGGYPGANTAEGQQALLSLSGGTFNTALGWSSLKSNISGNYNTGVGAGALVLNTSDQNTATGAGALLLNTSGFRNTANGAFALLHNNAADNTATGNAALFSNTTGSGNTATGNFSLVNNDTGSNNTATGNGALSANISGTDNTAIGTGALAANTVGGSNNAVGSGALAGNIDGTGNTAIGVVALFSNTSGIGTVALGHQALFNSTGDGNIGVGFAAGTGVSTASNVICIGATGANVNNTCFIGNINGVTLGAGSAVQIDANNQLGTIISSRRFKKDIQPMDKASNAILALKPVTFRYKTDTKGIAQFGLVAEEVAEVSADLVIRDSDGKPYTVRYDAVNAMLLNEFLKEHRKVQELQATVAQQQQSLQTRLAEQERQIEALASGLQKVSAQLEMTKLKPQVIARNGRENSDPLSAQHFSNQN